MEDKTEYILTEIDEISETMIENFQKVNQNVVSLEDLENKSEQILDMSETMKHKTTILTNVHWCEKYKYIIAATLTSLLVISLFLFIYLGFRS